MIADSFSVSSSQYLVADIFRRKPIFSVLFSIYKTYLFSWKFIKEISISKNGRSVFLYGNVYPRVGSDSRTVVRSDGKRQFLQENSGLSQLMGEFYSSGMEELLVMAESGKYSKSRMVSCIGHLDRTDVVYPLGNTECLCEVKNLTYQKLFQILAQEMNYTTIVLNLGSRFMGFFELLGSCQKIFLMKSRGGLGQWREKEFLTEIQKRGEERLSENLREIQLPLVASPVVSCERLVEQWKWNEFGDSIRRMMPVG